MMYRRLFPLAGVTAAIALSACSGVEQPSPAGPQNAAPLRALHRTIAPAPAHAPALVFAADEGSQKIAGGVYAYADTGSAQRPLWELTGAPLEYPDGLWVDGKRNLYVADAAGAVYEYDAPTSAGPPGRPTFTYDDSGYQPNHVAVCGHYLYAADTVGPSSASAYMTVWKLGTSAPAKVVAVDGPQGPGAGISCDDKTGSVYFGIDVSYEGPGQVDVYGAGGSGSPTSLCASLRNLEGLTFDKKYATFVSGDGGSIAFFAPSQCNPVLSLSASWIAGPVGFAYEKGDKHLWDADLGNQALHRFDPATGKLENTINETTSGTFAALQDVAVSPADHR
jgi:hypothetical protein